MIDHLADQTVETATSRYRREFLPRGRRVFVTTLGFGLLLTLGAAGYVYELRERQDLDRLERHAQRLAGALQRELDLDLTVVEGLQGLFRASTHVSRQEFTTYSQPLLERHGSISALEWIPQVVADQRDRLQSRARIEGFDQYTFLERAPSGTLVEAGQRDRYFPVHYVEPLFGNEEELGYDLGSDREQLTSLLDALQTGGILVTQPVNLVKRLEQAQAQRRAVLILAPVSTRQASPPEAAPQQGLVASVISIESLMARVHASIGDDFPPVQMLLWDGPLEALSQPMAAETPVATKRNLLYPLEVPAGLDSPQVQRHLQVPGRAWLLQAAPAGDWYGRAAFRSLVATLAAGSLLSLFAAICIRMLRVRRDEDQVRIAQQNRKLGESEKKLSAILDTAVDAIITIDARGRIQLFNPGAERLFGYSADEVSGRNVSMLMPEPHRSRHDGYLQHYLTTGEARIIGIGRETEAQRKDGTRFPMQLSVGHIALEDESLFVGTLIDLSLQKESEATLRFAKQEAEAANRQKSEFVNMMSHELRTPLTVILGYLPLLKQFESLPEPAMVVGIAEDMETSGNHLLHLINDLLDLSKIEAGRLSLRPQWLESQQQVEQAIQSMRGKAAQKGLALRGECSPFEMFADPVRIQQILINLIGNAIKFTSQGEVVISAEGDGTVSRWQVTDSGCGIAPEDQATVFEKFRQVDSTSTRNVGGTGLGLAITRQLVALHGGEIEVRSMPGKGSTFEFSIDNEVVRNGQALDG